jgi:hypothetical protein
MFTSTAKGYYGVFRDPEVYAWKKKKAPSDCSMRRRSEVAYGGGLSLYVGHTLQLQHECFK